MKYIVKNCPALSYGRGLGFKKCYRTNWKEYCKDCPDCVIKQIVGLCKEDKKPIRSWTEKGTCYDFELKKVVETDIVVDEFGNDKYLADNILNLLEIEEANEE